MAISEDTHEHENIHKISSSKRTHKRVSKKTVDDGSKKKKIKLMVIIILVLLVIQLYAIQFLIVNEEYRKPDYDWDDDGLTNEWEQQYKLDPRDSTDRDLDPDMDSLTNIQEFENNTNPLKSDSDGDYLPDNWEILYGFDPVDHWDNSTDSDEDGLTNYEEFQIATDPLNADTDYDSLPDAWEYEYNFDPLNDTEPLKDFDNDNVTNLGEYLNGTHPRMKDTDGDDIDDHWEIHNSLNPLNGTDAEADPDLDEQLLKNLASERLLRRLAVLDLSPGELPHVGQTSGRPSLRCEYPLFAHDDGTDHVESPRHWRSHSP